MSTSLPPSPTTPANSGRPSKGSSSRSIQRTFVLVVGGIATVVLAAGTYAQLAVLSSAAENSAETRLRDLGFRAAKVVGSDLRTASREREAGDSSRNVAETIETSLLVITASANAHVALIDSGGAPMVIATSDTLLRGKLFPGASAVASASETGEADFDIDESHQHAIVSSVADGRYRLVAYSSEKEVMAPYQTVQRGLFIGAILILVGIITLLVFGTLMIARRISRPAVRLARAAEAIASGDLTVEVPVSGSGDEVDRLAVAVSHMVDDLRHLAGALGESARETNALSGEISAGAEEMAAAAGEIATTASELSRQSTQMAGSITGLATSAEHLTPLASAMDAGAREGVERNGRLRALALENRARLDDSNKALGLMATDVEANARATEALASASEEIASFVTQIRKLARQSKLLALNAAMEAARAGEHGQGFAVVAEEVRRLAGMSTDAAERTQAVVHGVLGAITQSRDASTRAVDTVRAVKSATSHASSSFEQIEQVVAEMDAWTSSIEETSTATNHLVREMTVRLEALTQGTESFAAAMEQVAASSQEQSASTEEIAAAATTLSSAADRLQRLVANLRIEETQAVADDTSLSEAPGELVAV
jgi:methyl-accepting chemotaxis protein